MAKIQLNYKHRKLQCSKAYITVAIQLWYDYDTRYDDTTTHSTTTTEVIEITICVQLDCDTTTTKKLSCSFFLTSNRVEWKQARAIRRSRIVVVSQSNRKCDKSLRTQIVISITFVVVECVVVSSYCSRIACHGLSSVSRPSMSWFTISNALAKSIQRYLTYELGSNSL